MPNQRAAGTKLVTVPLSAERLRELAHICEIEECATIDGIRKAIQVYNEMLGESEREAESESEKITVVESKPKPEAKSEKVLRVKMKEEEHHSPEPEPEPEPDLLHEHARRSERVRVRRGLSGFKDEDVDPRVITAVKGARGLFSYNHGKAVDSVLSAGYTWDSLCEACKLYLLMYVKKEEDEDDEEPSESLDYTAEKLDGDRNDVYDLYRRIVKIGEDEYDLRTS